MYRNQIIFHVGFHTRQPVQQKLTFLQPVTLQIEGKDKELVVGLSPHISVDMLLGREVPHFRKLLKEALEEESSIKPETNLPSEETKEGTRIQTSLVTTRAQLDRQHLQDLQEQKEQEEDEPVIHSVDSDSLDDEGEEENTLNSWTKSIHHGRLSRNLLMWQYSILLLLITRRSCRKMVPLYKRSERRQRHKVLPIFGKMIF